MPSRSYKISGPDDTLKKLDKFLLAVSKLGDWGASRAVQMFIDGDGHERLSVKGVPNGTKIDRKSFNDATEKDTIDVRDLKVEELITLIVEAEKRDSQSTKFVKQLDKGQKVKADTILDLPFRDVMQNVDQDITWRSSSTSPFK